MCLIKLDLGGYSPTDNTLLSVYYITKYIPDPEMKIVALVRMNQQFKLAIIGLGSIINISLCLSFSGGVDYLLHSPAL